MLTGRVVVRVAFFALAAWVYLYRLDAPPLLSDPAVGGGEAKYAEVAREMVESGDWLTPQLNGAPFLNKPPLDYWLIALSYSCFGVNEFAARLAGACTALVLLWLATRLAADLWDDPLADLWAGAVLLGTGTVLLEARMVGVDMLLSAAIVGSWWAATRLAAAPHRAGPLHALQAALAAGILAKGVLGVVFPVAAIGAAVVVAGRWDVARRLLHWRAWWLFVLLAAPWFAVTAVRHPGFAWDYFINQHVMAFVGRQVPRYAEGISLGAFWLAFAARCLPWTPFLPLAAVMAWREADGPRGRWAAGLLLGAAGFVPLFFSATAARLEHYSLPAIAACALLVTRVFVRPDRLPQWVLPVHVLPLAVAALALPLALPSLIALALPGFPVAGLMSLARTAGVMLAVAAVVSSILAIVRHAAGPSFVPLPIALGMCALTPLMQRGLTPLAPAYSSAGAAAVINATAGPTDTLVYEAPAEYQSGAGLFFYTRRPWLLLQSPDFAPHAYFAPYVSEMFVSREELEALWRNGPVFFVSNPWVVGRTSLRGVVPDPVYIVARTEHQWIVSNQRP